MPRNTAASHSSCRQTCAYPVRAHKQGKRGAGQGMWMFRLPSTTFTCSASAASCIDVTEEVRCSGC